MAEPVALSPRAGKPYIPSTGSEGMDFENAMCSTCRHYQRMKRHGELDCAKGIITRAQGYADVTHPRYPKQWVYNDAGYPTCTAQEPRGRFANPSAELAAYERAMRGE